MSPAALVFKDVIESQSNGQMQDKIHAASSMGNQKERMEQTKANIIQVNIASIGGLAQLSLSPITCTVPTGG